jgi:alcohol dehydrogenase (cytochrome c)
MLFAIVSMQVWLYPSFAAGNIHAAPAFTAGQLTQLPASGWLTNGGNLYNQRYSPLTSINRETVPGMKARWRTHLNGSGMKPTNSGQAQSLVYAGVLYIVTGDNDVFALDVETGKILWVYEAHLEPDNVLVCCGWLSRGLGMGDGRIYLGRLDARLIALDQNTGEVVWDIQAENPHEGYSITAAPLYYNGMVITGFAGGEKGIRGRLKAYDATDGSLLWTFYTIPAPDEFGGDSWPAYNDAWKYGGAPVWQTPAIDPELGMIYFSTGNAAPDLNGAVRPGDNLFTASIVALDVATGAYRWHFQQVHHDIWDYDSPNPVILFDAPYNGIMRKGLAEASKTGWVYILDRETGEPLIGIEERPVPQEPRQATSPTQPFPVGDAVVPQFIDIAPEGIELVNEGRIFTPFWKEMVAYKPMMAANWPPSAYDPETHLFYVCASDNIGSSMIGEAGFEPPAYDGTSYLGGSFGQFDLTRRGVFAAVDITTNRLAWQQQWPEQCMSGSVVTAGGLVFIGRSDGRLTALDKANGKLLWEFQTDAGINSTVTTFDHKGTQYVAVLSAGSMYARNRRGDSIWMFTLDGAMDPVVIPAGIISGTDIDRELEVLVIEGETDTVKGRKLYQQNCSACHGDAGRGGQDGGGPSLEQAAVNNYTGIIRTVWLGGNEMPTFRYSLSKSQIRDISRYITDELF